MLPASDRRTYSGHKAEDYVAGWLEQQGFKILARNYKKTVGEIDIIATQKDIISFIEVKSHTHDYFNLSNVITQRKQHKIIRTAQTYLLQYNITDKVIRFDVALVLHTSGNYTLEYIPNAFTQPQEY